MPLKSSKNKIISSKIDEVLKKKIFKEDAVKIFNGGFFNGKRHGFFTLVMKSGIYMEGTYKNG